ncbi:MAG: hypothetical protein ACN4GZ_15820 [Acidimicrobiales bacterium]
MKLLAPILGLVFGWFAGGWLYLAFLGVLGEDKVSGSYAGAVLGLLGAAAGSVTAYRLARKRNVADSRGTPQNRPLGQ